jgi:hypothetical protein
MDWQPTYRRATDPGPRGTTSGLRLGRDLPPWGSAQPGPIIATIFCIIYTTLSLCAGLSLHYILKKKNENPPAIKPENYQDENMLLRKSLNAVNWSLVANKARALYYMKCVNISGNKLKKSLKSASFTLGQQSFSVCPFSETKTVSCP